MEVSEFRFTLLSARLFEKLTRILQRVFLHCLNAEIAMPLLYCGKGEATSFDSSNGSLL
jgi:hypothetical protein